MLHSHNSHTSPSSTLQATLFTFCGLTGLTPLVFFLVRSHILRRLLLVSGSESQGERICLLLGQRFARKPGPSDVPQRRGSRKERKTQAGTTGLAVPPPPPGVNPLSPLTWEALVLFKRDSIAFADLWAYVTVETAGLDKGTPGRQCFQ